MDVPATVIKYRWPILVAFVATAVVAALQLRRVTIEADIQKLLPESIPSRVDTRKIEEIFGGTDMLFFVFETGDVLAEPTLRRLKRIDKKLERIDGVNSILSLFSAKNITGRDGAMIVEPVVNEIPRTGETRERLRELIRGNELAYGLVVSRDFRLAAFMLTLAPDADEDDVYSKAKAIIAGIPGNERVFAGGQPAFRSTLHSDIIRDIGVLVPAALIVMLGVLFAFFRQLRGVILPFGAVVLSMMFGTGLLPFFGWKMTLITVILPIMVVAIANNYGIHLVAKYQELNDLPGDHTRKGLAAEVLRQLWSPVLITGLTTVAGILGLLTHVMLPARQIGIAAAIAICFALALSLLAIPAALSMMRIPRRGIADDTRRNGFVGRILQLTGDFITARPKTVLIASAVLTAAGIVGTFLLKTDANQENLFAPAHPISQTTRIVNRYFGGTQNISMLVHGDIKDPSLLSRMSGYQRELEHLEGVGGSTSIADVIRIMSKAINDSGEAGWDRIPPTRDAVAQYVELYSMSGEPDDFERMVDFNYENAQCIVRINNGSTPVVKKIVGRIRSIMATDSSIVRIGGFAVILAELGDAIFSGQISSLLFAIGAIIFLMMLLFRSISAGILSAVPLAISVILGFGFMGLSGIHLDIATAMITSIVIGAGVDYTIHFLWRYRNERRGDRSYRDAVCRTLTTTGRGILFNALSVAAGFAALFLSSMPPLRFFALLFILSILTCMAGALVVVPCLCLVFKPKFLEPKRRVLFRNSSSPLPCPPPRPGDGRGRVND
ncbi:MAG: RND family transporter [Chitinispirillaceae bacterium]|nr:RND family transporter [Chitinispirillaceae bacterium]